MAFIMCKKYIISAKIYIESISGNQKLQSYSASRSFNAGEKEIAIVLLRVPRHVERSKMPNFFFGCRERARASLHGAALSKRRFGMLST